MTKQYEYLLVLTLQTSSVNQNHKIHPILNHKITPNDITEIENKYSSQGFPWMVTFFNEPKVTGDFTYRFLFTYQLPDGTPILRAFNKVFDHQITTQTITADYDNFRKEFLLNNSGSSVSDISILLHQEIPDE